MEITRVAALWFASLLVGEAAFAAAGWTGAVYITEINQQPVGGVGSTLVFIETTATAGNNPSGCSFAPGFYFSVDDDRKKRIFSTLLAAQIANRPIKIYVTGVCHNPWNYALLDGLVMN